jgi:hypothetical protein
VEPNPSGLCQCGCGQLAPIARQTDTRLGYVRGKPIRFIRGHVGNLKRRDRLDESLWHLENRGYVTVCWIWNGAPNKRTGYCRVKYRGKFWLPHRAVYEQEVGPIPAGYDVDHLCSQRQCVRPDHLEAVTRAVNIQRSATARLTPDDIELIRRSALSARKIAALLNVGKRTVDDVRRGRTWQQE